MFTNVTLLYFLLLIPLSGFIAWLGDRIGHKSGKRRHTLFGLRPRHTAMVFTIGTGMCISLVSFGLMCGLSEAFRVVVRDGVRLYDTNRELKHNNIALAQGNAALQRIAAKRKLEADSADQKRIEALQAESRAEAATKIADIAQARAVADQKKAEAEVGQALSRLALETHTLQSAQGSLRTAQSSLRTIQGTLKDRNASLLEANRRVALAQKQVDAATARVQLARKDADTAQENVKRVQNTAQLAIAQQAATLSEQNKSLVTLRGQFDDQAKLYDAQKKATEEKGQELARLNSEVTDSENRLHQIQANTEALRGKSITYQVNEEVDRLAIKPGYNVWRVEAILGSFLATAAKKAEMRGARKDKNGDSTLVILPPTPDDALALTTGAKSRKHPLTEGERMDETISAAAATIRTKNTDVVVLVSAVANAVAGEPVAITLKLYPNPIVFPADAQIGDAHINGKGSPTEIADALTTFLSNDLRPTLLHAGVIPKSPGGSESDAAFSLGSLSGDDWLHIMDRIRMAGDNARVVVTASHDMRAGDNPVPLQFDVKGVPSGIFRESALR